MIISYIYHYSYPKQCEHVPDYLIGTPIKGIGLASRMNYPTVNYTINEAIPCGIYTVDSQYGNAVVFANKFKPNILECHFLNFRENMKDIIDNNNIYMFNIIPFKNDKSLFLKTYLSGCKS